MAKKKLSRDQKRKQKLQKRPHAAAGVERQNAAEKLLHDGERIIYETFISYGRSMHDEDALDAVNQLMVDIQHGDITKQDASLESPNAKGALVWNIKQRWSETRVLETMPHLVAAQAMQTLAQRVHGIMAPGESHSYLRFLQGSEQTAVLAAAAHEGVVAAGAEPNTEPQLPNGDWSREETPLLAVGLTWLRGSSEESWQSFQTEATRLTDSGQAQAVANVSQYLYGLLRADAVEAALRPVLNAAHAKLVEALDDETDEAAATPEPGSEAELRTDHMAAQELTFKAESSSGAKAALEPASETQPTPAADASEAAKP